MKPWRWIGIGALVAVLAWQTWTIVSLRGEVAELRDAVGPGSADDEQRPVANSAPAIRPGSPAAPAIVDRPATRTLGMTPPSSLDTPKGVIPDPAALDEAVERSVERVQQARFTKKAERRMQRASDRIDRVVAELIDEGELSEKVREQVTDLLRNELYQNWQLKTDVKSGALSEEDAVAKYQESHAAFTEALNELVGEDTAEELLARAGRRPKGRR